MGRKGYATYGSSWTPPDYEVDERGKLVGGYTPPGRHNWGRWGEEDERGAANLTTPAMIAAAAKLVESGEVFSLALPIGDPTPAFPGRPTGKHYFLMSGTDAVSGSPYNEHAPGFVYNDDAIDIVLQGSTQWDGLAHAVAEDSVYNGFWAGNVTAMVASVALTVWLPNELRGLAIGAFIAIAGLIGFGVAPSLVTVVSGFLGGEGHLAAALAIVGVAVSIISVLGFWLAMKRAPEIGTFQKGVA